MIRSNCSRSSLATLILTGSIVALLGSHSAQAAVLYWDSDGTTAGLGSTTGTWGTSTFIVAPANANLRTALLGNLAASGTANLSNSTDSLWFGTDNLALTGAATTIGTSGTLTVNNLTFGAGQTSAVTLGAGGTLTLAGTTPSITVINTADTIATTVAGTVGLVKLGAGKLTLTGGNTFTGGLTIAGGGTLQIGNGTLGSLTSQALTFNNGGGVFNVQEAAGSTQAMGALTFSTTGAGESTVQSTYAGSGNSALTFTSLAARGAGATGNFVVSGGANGTTNQINLTQAAGFIDKGVFFNGSSYAAMNAANTYVRELQYGTDASTSPANTIGAGTHVQLTSTPVARAGDTLLSLNLAGSGVDYTMSSGTLTVPGILKSGGGTVSTISGGTAVTSGAGVELVIRTDTSADLLTISSAVTGTGALTKSGAGTVTLSSTSNSYSGTTTINAGTLAVSGGSAISNTGTVVLANSAGAVFQLNNDETIGNLSGGGLAGGNVNVQGNTLTFGDAGNQTFSGNFIGSGGIIKQGAGTLTLSNPNTFAGTTTVNAGAIQFAAISLGVASGANYSVSSGGTFTLAGGTSLNFTPSSPTNTFAAQSQLTQPNGLAFGNAITVSSGTASLKTGTGNGNRYVFTGNVTGNTSGSQTLAILQGALNTGSGDGGSILLSGVIANGSGGTLGVNVDFGGASGVGQTININLSGQNTFTGPISVTNSKGLTNGGFFVIGGEKNAGGLTPGTGALGWNGTNGNYTNTIALASGTILTYASSAAQTLGGAISGAGSVQKDGAGTLTLSNAGHTGSTTVNSGVLVWSGANNLTAATTTVNAAGTLSLADGTARNTTAGTLTLATGSVLGFDWNGTTDTADNLAPTVAITPAVGASIGIIVKPTGTPSTTVNLLTGITGSTLNNPNYFLANNTNFTATLTKPGAGAGSLTIGGYAAVTALTNAYWKGGLTNAVGAMAFSTGTSSNWFSTAAGAAAGGVVPGGSAVNVIFGATGGTNQSAVTTGAPMDLGSITFNDTAAVTLAGSHYLTLNSTSSTPASTTAALATVTPGSAISVTSFANATNTISANLLLGANQTWNVATGKTLTVSGLIAGTNSLTKADAGALTLSGSNPFSGGVTLDGGTINANSNASLGTGALTFSGSGLGLLLANGVTLANNITIGTNSGVSGAGLIKVANGNTATLSGTITINNGAAAGGHFGADTPAGTGILNITGPVISSVAVSARSGTVVFSGGGSYTDLGVGQATVKLAANNGISTSATVNVATVGTQPGNLDLAGYNQQLAGITKGGGTVATIGNSSTATDSTLTTTGTSSYAGAIQDTLGAGNKKVALTVNGGALTLTGTNTYTGATTIAGGTLSINGSLANTATTVQTGAFLKGSGSIAGSVTVQNGGTIATGNSIESLATGALSLDAGSTFAFELDNNAVANLSGDLTAVTGNLTIAPTNDALLTLTELGAGSWAPSEKLTLISYSGTWNGGLLDYLGADILDDSTITLGGDTWLFNYNDTTKGDNYTADATGTSFVTMTVQPVPEPHTALLAGLGLLALLRRRRA